MGHLSFWNSSIARNQLRQTANRCRNYHGLAKFLIQIIVGSLGNHFILSFAIAWTSVKRVFAERYCSIAHIHTDAICSPVWLAVDFNNSSASATTVYKSSKSFYLEAFSNTDKLVPFGVFMSISSQMQ
jgi:hypothetical protein